MASPVDSARQGTNITTAATSHAINVGSPVAGTLLIVLVRFAAAPGTVTFTGYTQLGSDTSDATDDQTMVFWRLADGTEGATDTLTTANSVKACAISWEITGAADPLTRPPEISTVAVGTTTANTGNPASRSVTGGPKDVLYIAMMGLDGELNTPTAAPTNYNTTLVTANSGTAGAVATNCSIAGGSRAVSASSSDDPGTFTHAAATTGWTAWTVVIHPVGPVSTADTGATISDSLVSNRSRSMSDTGATVTGDSIARAFVRVRAVSDTATTMSDSFASQRTRQLADTAATITDSFSLSVSVFLTDTGTTITDTFAQARITQQHVEAVITPTDQAGRVSQQHVEAVITPTDQAARLSQQYLEVIVRPLRTARVSQEPVEVLVFPNPKARISQLAVEVLRGPLAVSLGDTAATISDTIGVLRALALTDTAATITDSVAVPYVRSLTDTGATVSDSISSNRSRTLTDTGTTPGDSLASSRSRSLTDTAATVTDTFSVQRSRSMTDTGATVTDTVASKRTRALTDTAATISDTLASRPTRKLADTAVTLTDSISASSSGNVSITDTGATITSTVSVRVSRSMADTGATVSDSVASTPSRSRSLTDTGATVSDSIASKRVRALADTATTFSDSVARAATHPRTASDTGTTVSDTLASRRHRMLADTGATIVDTPAAARFRSVTDTGTTISDSLASRRFRSLTDTATTASDSIARHVNLSRSLTDTGATVTGDSISSVAGGVTSRTTTDTALTLNDSLRILLLHRKIVDTGLTLTDNIGRFIPRTITDTGATISDTIVGNDLYDRRTVISGTAGAIFGATYGATVSPGEFRPGNSVSYGSTVWYEWTAPANGKFRFRVNPYQPDPVSDPWIAIYEYDPGAVHPTLAHLVVWNDFPTWSDTADFDDAVVNFRATAGTKYIVQVGAWSTKRFTFDLVWQTIDALAPDADDFPGLTIGNNEILTQNPEYATEEPGDPWYWIREMPDWQWSVPSWGQYTPANRTMLYKFTPDTAGTVEVTFFEVDTSGSETGEVAAFVFDGDGVTDISQLTPARLLDSAWFIFSGVALSFTGVAGRDYYLWIASDDGADYPDTRFRFKVRWPMAATPANDDAFNAESLDDGNWHPGTTENATWQPLPGAGPFPGNPLDNNPVETPQPATVWYRASLGSDEPAITYEFRNLDQDLQVEYWMPIDRYDEYVYALVDTGATITDGLANVDLTSFTVSDTAVTQSEALALKVTRALTDTGASITDVVQKGPADVGAKITDTVSKRVSRKMTDSSGTFSGPGVSEGFGGRVIKRGRAMSDTGTTISDSLAIIQLKHYNLVDTGASISSTIVRTPMTYLRTPVSVGATISDALTRIPPVTVTDTGATISDAVARNILRGRAVADNVAAGTSDSIKTNRVRLQDYGIDAFGSGTMIVTLQRFRVTRKLTDTGATISDSIS